MDGFILVISESGKINYVSESVTTLLGYMPVSVCRYILRELWSSSSLSCKLLQSDLMNSSLYDLIPADERSTLFNVLAGNIDDKSKQNFFVTLNVRLGGLEIHQEDNRHQLVKFNGYYKRMMSDRKTYYCFNCKHF